MATIHRFLFTLLSVIGLGVVLLLATPSGTLAGSHAKEPPTGFAVSIIERLVESDRPAENLTNYVMSNFAQAGAVGDPDKVRDFVHTAISLGLKSRALQGSGALERLAHDLQEFVAVIINTSKDRQGKKWIHPAFVAKKIKKQGVCGNIFFKFFCD